MTKPYMLSTDLIDTKRAYLWEKFGDSTFGDVAVLVQSDDGISAISKTLMHPRLHNKTVTTSQPGETLEQFAERVYALLMLQPEKPVRQEVREQSLSMF
jgi:hypothetical protein